MKHISYLLAIVSIFVITSCTCKGDIETGPKLKYRVEMVAQNESNHQIAFPVSDKNYLLYAPNSEITIYDQRMAVAPENILVLRNIFSEELIVSFDDEYFITYSLDDKFHSLLNAESYVRNVDDSGEKITFTFTFTDEDYEYAMMYGSPAVEKFISE